ncbi:MAG TPA: ABC transporter permease [Actinomycetes bacterium]
MSTTPATAPATVAPVRVPAGGLRQDVRAAKIVCQRELIRFGRDRARIVSSMIQPVLWLFVLGTGLSSVIPRGSGGVDFRTFLFPGVLAMSLLFTAAFSGVSIVWDREFGFLREMLVAPVRRSAIIAGKAFGGAIVATLQSLVMLALAGLVHVPYSPGLLLPLFGLLFLTAFTITAFGIMLSARLRQIQTIMPLMQMVIAPMMFLSGALFPLVNLPTWLQVLTRVNPLTYAVDPMRAVVFQHLDLSPAALHALRPGVTWGGWPVPTSLEVLLLAVMSVVMLTVAILRFDATE